MITNIKLTNFKCFADLSLYCAPLTLLCGLNGMGKSSVLQALLTLHGSYQTGDLLNGHLSLGSELVNLGTGADILFEDAPADIIEFAITDSDLDRPWHLNFQYSRDADQLIADPKRKHRPPSYVPMEWRNASLFKGPLTYISAERIGPRKSHIRSETASRQKHLGSRGEYVINFLHDKRSETFHSNDSRLVKSDRIRLIEILDDWLQAITPGAHLSWDVVSAADALIAGFSFDRTNDVGSKRYRATNVGFGLSYVLPVLVAMLSPRGSLVLIENPEAHLHPQGQTALGELAVRSAQAGVQLFIETHSDHFMDGIRIAVRDAKISADNVAIHYFSRLSGRSEVTSPTLDMDGRLSHWPPGFFDQHDENIMRLLAPNR